MRRSDSASGGVFEAVRGIDWETIRDAAATAFAVIPGPFQGIARIWENREEILAGAQGALELVLTAFELARNWVSERKEAVVERVSELIGMAQDAFMIARNWIAERRDWVISEAMALVNGVVDGVRTAKDAFVSELIARWNELVALGAEIVSWLRSIPETVRAGIGDLQQLGRDVANAIIIDPVNAVIGFLDRAAAKLPGISGIGIDQIDRLATGTGFYQGGLALVGELGPELAYLPRGTQVLPAPRTQAILDLMTARNLESRQQGARAVQVEINFPNVAVIDERMLERIKAEVVKVITEVLDD